MIPRSGLGALLPRVPVLSPLDVRPMVKPLVCLVREVVHPVRLRGGGVLLADLAVVGGAPQGRPPFPDLDHAGRPLPRVVGEHLVGVEVQLDPARAADGLLGLEGVDGLGEHSGAGVGGCGGAGGLSR